jgi:peptide-N4-(N-acetyl-beta-glucosaminyl)asparagine amidase
VQQVRAESSRKFQGKARVEIPLDVLKARAAENPNPLPGRDELLRQLLHWFKKEFFSWVNALPCTVCGGDTESAGASQPNMEEQRFRAGVVELYKCKSCRAVSRFPRYNHSGKLMETKRGRCGEWAQAFTLCCRALGYEARYVVDWTDHVWTEVYSQYAQRWMHCDPCEDAYDKPLLYETGWGKKLNYVIAFSVDEIRDVTRRYSKNYDETLGRRDLVHEDWLERYIQSMSDQRRLSPERRADIEARWATELKQMNSGVEKEDEPESLPGRKTGSVEWRQARGEMGTKQPESKSKSSQAKNSADLQKLIVAIYTQITTGCGNDACTKEYCKSSSQKDELPTTKAEMLKLSISLARNKGQAVLCSKK